MSLVAAYLRRDWRTARTHRVPFLLDGMGVLAAATSFYFLSRFVGKAGHGGAFFAFATAGLAVLRVQASLPRAVSSVTDELSTGTLELTLSSPARPEVVLTASTAFEMARGACTGALLILIAAGLSPVPFHLDAASVGAVALGLVGAAVLFAALAVAVLGVVLVVRQGAAIAAVIAILVPVVSGAYYPLRILPEPLRLLAEVLPFHFAVDLVRFGLLQGTFDVTAAAGLCLGALAEVAVAVPLARVGVAHARHAGNLALA